MTEAQVLVEFFQATGGYTGERWWWEGFGWWAQADPCDPQLPWFGVLCDTDGHVVALSLANNHLVGTVPSSISQLEHLRYLDLRMSCLRSLPTSIADLKYLEQLQLDSGGWNEGGFESCGAAGTFTSLPELPQSLRVLSIGQLDLTSLPDLAGLKKLARLRIAYNPRLRGSMPALPQSLRSLDAAACGFTDATSLADLPNLGGGTGRYCNISGNPFKAGGVPSNIRAKCFPTVDAINDPPVRRRDVAGSTLSRKRRLPVWGSSLRHNATVSDDVGASLRMATHSDTSAQVLPDSEMQALEYLRSSTNGATWAFYWGNSYDANGYRAHVVGWLDGDPCDESTPWMGVLCGPDSRGILHVVLIDLVGMTLNTDVTDPPKTLPQEIGALPCLRLLDIQDNFFHGWALPPTVGEWLELEQLLMDYSYVGGALPDAITKLQRLSILTAYGQCYPATTGQAPQCLTSLPADLANMQGLVYVRVSENQIAGSLPNLGKMPNLMVFLGDSNKFNGTLPSNIGDMGDTCRGLTAPTPHGVVISLQFNELTGGIPPGVESMKCLSDFNVSHNQLSGLAPHVPAGCVVDLSGNNFSGSLYGLLCAGAAPPASFSCLGVNPTPTLPTSTNVRVNANLFDTFGDVDIPTCGLTHLELIDVSDNRLIVGNLPDLSGARALKTINIARTGINGTLYKQPGASLTNGGDDCKYIATDPKLKWGQAVSAIWAENAQLCGTIPPNIGGDLTVINVQGNQLTGTIPNLYSTKLTTMLVSGNKLRTGNGTSGLPTLPPSMTDFEARGLLAESSPRPCSMQDVIGTLETCDLSETTWACVPDSTWLTKCDMDSDVPATGACC